MTNKKDDSDNVKSKKFELIIDLIKWSMATLVLGTIGLVFTSKFNDAQLKNLYIDTYIKIVKDTNIQDKRLLLKGLQNIINDKYLKNLLQERIDQINFYFDNIKPKFDEIQKYLKDPVSIENQNQIRLIYNYKEQLDKIIEQIDQKKTEDTIPALFIEEFNKFYSSKKDILFLSTAALGAGDDIDDFITKYKDILNSRDSSGNDALIYATNYNNNKTLNRLKSYGIHSVTTQNSNSSTSSTDKVYENKLKDILRKQYFDWIKNYIEKEDIINTRNQNYGKINDNPKIHKEDAITYMAYDLYYNREHKDDFIKKNLSNEKLIAIFNNLIIEEDKTREAYFNFLKKYIEDNNIIHKTIGQGWVGDIIFKNYEEAVKYASYEYFYKKRFWKDFKKQL